MSSSPVAHIFLLRSLLIQASMVCIAPSTTVFQPIATGVNRKQGWQAHDWIQTNVEDQGARPEESPVVENGRKLQLRLVRGTKDSKPQATATPAFRKDMEHQNFYFLLHVGHDGIWNEAEALRVLQAGEGRNEEASGSGQAGRGAEAAAAAAAAAAEAAGAEAGEGPSAAGAAGPVDDGNQEGAAGGHGQENEPQPQEPDRGAMGANEAAPAPRPKRSRFTRWQLSELETAFQSAHYIKAKARKQLAASIGVSETKVQNWFKRKREKYRKYEKA